MGRCRLSAPGGGSGLVARRPEVSPGNDEGRGPTRPSLPCLPSPACGRGGRRWHVVGSSSFDVVLVGYFVCANRAPIGRRRPARACATISSRQHATHAIFGGLRLHRHPIHASAVRVHCLKSVVLGLAHWSHQSICSSSWKIEVRPWWSFICASYW